VLHRAIAEGTNSPLFEVAAAGYWHKDDTKALQQMLEPVREEKRREEKRTPFRISRPDPSDNPLWATLFNLAKATGVAGDDAKQHENSVDCCGTSRVIRIYQNKGKRIELVQRIDWETQASTADAGGCKENSDGTSSNDILKTQGKWLGVFKDYLKEPSTEEDSIHAVVIKDSCKSVVSRDLVHWLVEQPRLKNAQWFISSKAWPHQDERTERWDPEWLNELADVDVRLIVIPQVAAQTAVDEGVLSHWITESGLVTREAFSEIDRLAGIFKYSRDLLTVVLPQGHLLARYMFNLETQSGMPRGLVQKFEFQRLEIEVPMTSVLFPALIAHKLWYDTLPLQPGATLRLEEILRNSLNFTKEWMKSEIDRVQKPEDSQPNTTRLEFTKDWTPGKPTLKSKTNGVAFPTGKNFCWRVKKEIWKQALEKVGVIDETHAKKTVDEQTVEKLTAAASEKAGAVSKRWLREWDRAAKEPSGDNQNGNRLEGKKLELWRAMTDVEGYVCCVDSKRKVLRKIVKELNSFIGSMQRHTSLMLIASPGSGKTFLVKRLAKSLDMQLLQFNITQMGSRDDLFGCFDTIIALQDQDPKKPILVFVDEINAELDGQHVYGTFLDPIQEGSYVRAGKTFRIGPCAWMFAGTERPDQMQQNYSSKGNDFVTRLTLPPQDLKAIGGNQKEQEKTEKVYLGVSLIQTVFPDVRKVSEKVLKLFHALPDNNGNEIGAREVEHFVRSFDNVQHGEVRSGNVDIHDERFTAYIPDLWCGDPEDKFVEISS
jgi:hypothetical protein